MSKRLLVLAVVPVLGALLVACAQGTGPAAIDSGLATLTAQAAGQATAQPPDQVAGLDQPATLEPAGTQDPSAVLDPAQAQTAAAEDRARTASTMEIVPAQELVPLLTAQPPLATFTPSKNDQPTGKMLYVRNGKLYRVTLGEKPEAVEGAPSVWAPPDDPGRAWMSPNGDKVAFFADRDANMWVADGDGSHAKQVGGASIPTGEHTLEIGSQKTTVRLHPGQDYTLVLLEDHDPPVSLLVDDNSREAKGAGRLRVVHAAAAAKDKTLTVVVNGDAFPHTVAYGESTGDERVVPGAVNIDLQDASGNRVAHLGGIHLDDKELKTIFLFGDSDVNAVEATYEPQEAIGGSARVKVFNATGGSQTANADGTVVLTAPLSPGGLSAYSAVAALADNDQLAHLQQTMYGLVTGDAPIAWSPDGKELAYLAGPDGQPDLYLADLKGGAKRLSDDGGDELYPIWSPNGRGLAWVTLDPAYEVHTLYVRGADGAVKQVDLTPVLTAAGLAPDRGVIIPKGPGWVDDDTMFFYPVVEGISRGIWTVDVATGAAHQVYAQPIEDPEWSGPAGQWATYAKDPGEILTIAANGATKTVASGAVNAPHWSPDGKSIVYGEGDSTSPEGWELHIMNADGSNDRALTGRLPIMQESPPVPGPDAKLFWLDGGKELAFSVAGQDYGSAERDQGLGGKAGNDIANIWTVATDGGSAPSRVSDLMKVFYLKELHGSPDGKSIGWVGFSYLDRSQKLWAARAAGGKPVPVDTDVRWFSWIQ